MLWATLKGGTQTNRWRGEDFYFAHCSDLLGNAQVCTEDHGRGDASQEASSGSAQRTEQSPSNLCVVDVIKEAPEVWLPLRSHVWSREPV